MATMPEPLEAVLGPVRESRLPGRVARAPRPEARKRGGGPEVCLRVFDRAQVAGELP